MFYEPNTHTHTNERRRRRRGIVLPDPLLTIYTHFLNVKSWIFENWMKIRYGQTTRQRTGPNLRASITTDNISDGDIGVFCVCTVGNDIQIESDPLSRDKASLDFQGSVCRFSSGSLDINISIASYKNYVANTVADVG